MTRAIGWVVARAAATDWQNASASARLGSSASRRSPVKRRRDETGFRSATILPIRILVAVLLIALVGARVGRAQEPAFRIEPLPRSAAELAKRFTQGQLAILEKLNRRDLDHLPRTEPAVPGLVVPQEWPPPDDAVAFSPLPDAFPWAQTRPKVLVVHQPWQVFAAYEYGQLVRWGPVSTGRRETPTPSGLFNLNWRSKGRHSTDNAAWFLPWYFNFHNARGVSFHQFDLPGYPASHACVRLLARDAQWLYDWGEEWTLDGSKRQIITPGTPVLIVAEYNHGAPPPWLDMTALATRLELAAPQMP
jgi:lipoprotein-anchoring transpeptidase ErfK/SrfK